MITFKKHRVILLPTQEHQTKESMIYSYPDGEILNSSMGNRYLYVLSDEEIKEGDYIRWGRFIYKVQFDTASNSLVFKTGSATRYVNSHKVNKIIASTDKSLNLPTPTDEFIQQWINAGCPEEIKVKYNQYNCKGYCDNKLINTYCYNSCLPSVIVNNNTINCRLIQQKETWEDILKQAPSLYDFVDWLEENYHAPKKK